MTFISTAGQAQDQVLRLKQLQIQLGTLQGQVASGKKTNLFKGLETDTIISKRTRADFQRLESYISNIDRGNMRIDMIMSSVTAIKTQTNNAIDSIVNQTQQGEVELDFIRTLADNAFDFIVDTLNTKDGDAYIFSATDTTTQPIIDSGALDAFFGDLNAQWSAGTLTINPPNTTIAEEYISRYRNIPATTLGFSGSLSNAKNVYVRADDSVEINYTLKADNDAFKDIVAGVMALKNIAELDSAPGATESDQEDNFFAVFNDVAKLLTDAVDALDLEGFKLGTAQVQLRDIRVNHVTEKNVLKNITDSIENVDMNEVALSVTALSTQLEASYQVTALVSQLNLSNFL